MVILACYRNCLPDKGEQEGLTESPARRSPQTLPDIPCQGRSKALEIHVIACAFPVAISRLAPMLPLKRFPSSFLLCRFDPAGSRPERSRHEVAHRAAAIGENRVSGGLRKAVRCTQAVVLAPWLQAIADYSGDPSLQKSLR